MFSSKKNACLSVLIVAALHWMVNGEDSVQVRSQCSNAKAESYLETASALIDRVRDNLPEGETTDCSCPPKPMDCDEVLKCGHNRSGIFQIWPRNRVMVGSVYVFCDMDTDGGGWTVLQRRGDFKRPADFFYKTWHKYKTGFGDLRRDFWLGNDNIYSLSNQKKYYLRIDLTDFDNNTRYAFYDQFWIDNESHHYKLHVYDYSGDAGDSFSRSHDNHMFSTLDRDNDNSTLNCAEHHRGGWWYAACQASNLNGIYNTNRTDSHDGIVWNAWKQNESLKTTEMKIRPMDFKMDLLDLDVDPA